MKVPMQTKDIADNNVPYWWEQVPMIPLPRQAVSQVVDVLIVGAGYAGLTAAMVLARAGRSVAVYDAMNLGQGASTRNGGITSGNIRPTFAAIAKRFGEHKATAIEAESKIAREFLQDLVQTEQLECDYQPTGLFSGAIGFGQYEAMARRAENLAKKLGVESYAVPYAEQHQYIGTDFYRGGTVRMDIGGLHPAKFHSELLRLAMNAGVAVHDSTPVTSIEKTNTGFRVTTPQGVVQALKVLVCTNGYTGRATPFLRRRLIPVTSRMIATEELSAEVMGRLMPKGMMTGEGLQLGYYYRPSPDGKRILLGGRDSSRKGDSVKAVKDLRKGLIERFPELETVRLTHTWFGNVAMNRDMLPRIFEHDSVLYATGFCGSGTVWAPWVGRLAADKLLGRKEGRGSAFDFGPPAPVPLYNGHPWFIPVVIAGYRLQDRFAMWRAYR